MRIYIILVIALAACKGNRNAAQVEEKDGHKIITVDAGDQMIAATEEAIKNYPLFEQAMHGPDTTLSQFGVRMQFTDGAKNKEHLWLKKLHNIGGQLFGVVDTEPMHVTGMKFGDTVRVVRNDITDWMYVKNGKLQGGYTLKVLYNSMDENMKRQFRSSVPFEIE